MIRFSQFVFVIVLSALSVQADSSSPYGLCASTETNFFSCETTNQKWISLCGTLPETLQYRFGTTDHLELKYPKNYIGSTAHFLYAHYMRFQTDRIEVRFCNLGFEYTIFDYTESHMRRAGVRVVSTDGTESEFICSDKISSRLLRLKTSLRCDSESALNVGNCPQ